MSRPRRWWRALAERGRAFWFGPVETIRLDTFRLATAASLLVYIAVRWPYAEEWLTDTGFHIGAGMYQHQPVLFPVLPHPLLPWFGLLFFSSLFALVAGWRIRLSAAVAMGCLTYVTHADMLMSFTINRLYIISLAVIAAAPPAADPRRDGRRTRASAWPVRTLQATLLLVYFGAAWCKMGRGDWLRDPLVLWSQVQGFYRTDLAAWMLRVLPFGVWSWMQYAALTFELFAPLLFGIRRLRPLAYVWGIGFQLLIALTMYELAYFSLQMVCYYVLFVDPRNLRRAHDAARRALRRLRRIPAAG